jgi:hypothetical protein
MGDMGEDMVKSMGAGCFVCCVFIGIIIGFEYFCVNAFFRLNNHWIFTFDSIIVFICLSVFFIASMWRFYKWAIELL